MRLIASDFISLDGVVQAPGGAEEDTDGGFAHGGWSGPYFDDEIMGPAIDAAMQNTEALLFGRRTWQSMAAAWPERAGDPFSDRMNSIAKFVVSRTLTQADLDWENSTLLASENPAHSVAQLKATGNGDLLIMGSPELVRFLVSHDLVDGFNLMIHPILVGGGKRLFPDDGVARTLQLEDVKQAASGVLIATYVRM